VTSNGSGQKITVAAAALAAQASSVTVVASGGVLQSVVSEPFSSVVGNHTLTITLFSGTYAESPALSQFAITTSGTPGFFSLTGGTVTRPSDTVVTITSLTPVTSNGSGQKITVAAAALATQATFAVVAASGVGPVESDGFSSVVGNDTLTITLNGGSYDSPALSHFTITTPGRPGFTSLTGGTVRRTSDTVVTITGLTPVTADGSGQKITVDTAALWTQSTWMSVTVVASGPAVPDAPDVYAAGYESNGSKTVAKVWKNGAATSLTDGTKAADAKAMYVSGSDVYVAGNEVNSSGNAVAKVWKNGVATSLTDGTYTARVRSLFVVE
jgi:hypothetical protein